MKRIAALILLASLSANAFAFDPFVVSDIRIDGLSRISAGTVYNYLPINKGDQLTNDGAQRAIRALYRTKFFSDVEFEREGSILVIKVVERPSIAKLTLRGNKDIKTDDLKKGLKEIGLTEGETFDRLALDNVQQELIRQYYNRGKYNVSVDPHVTRLDRNRVAVEIEIREGKAAKIKELNILGTHAFTNKQIREGFESDTTNWMSWYSKDDQYSREKLSGDLEKLQSYYMDRGYADFGVDSTQVAIAPDKRAMYIDASIKEGEIYKVADVKLLGDLILPEATMRQLVFIKSGETFNRAAVEASTKAIKAILANIGYAYAKVTPIPKLDKEKRTVDLTLYVEPGQRVYVRRVVFQGNTRTEDDVLRREMRQLEGSWYSQAAIDRSKVRLQRLGYFKKVDIDQKMVPGTQDKVDVTVKVEEQSAGSMQFGIGYSQYSGIILNASVSQNNLFGTGDSFSISGERSTYYDRLGLNYYNPYLTDSGIGIGYSASYSKTDYGNTDFANYATSAKSFSTYLGIPISETDGLRVGLGVSSDKVNLYQGYSPEVLLDYQNQIGNKTIHTWTGTLGWNHDTRNGYWAPTRGGLISASTDVALPGSTVQYWKLNTEINHYWPIGKGFVLYLDGQVGYGKTYGGNGISDDALAALKSASLAQNPNHVLTDMRQDLPFWQNYYAGGVRDVRGYQDNTLGPRVCIDGSAPDANGLCNSGAYYAQPIGGAFKVLGTAQVFLPLPFLKDVNTARVSWFMDVGNVYKDYKSFDASELRASTGLSLQWQAPIGPLIISFAMPLRSKAADRHYEERIQFTFGSQF
ncbi:outer membrane protein assembly factor BamA [Rhodanobacter thiooxydans]|uniref:Outer membrane protein assembly factor BamA n=1 Tax=Rhodanobacter thiooxydans TaxID=416169 RepID=A0A154QIB4_9GAMM|nr:outer membrane protein assembly factor BamA [Rhodanobacter thiooxydans]EIL97881.1 outer membrane protein assembly complex, YaeT protein [Rhodanobacter thiooxydans LCS2]KZC23869.1 outer membrane protein assembly factor BamA [Rhodanobacter thiooxydans]MCW0202298.1 outer membrane protein assembly factor BamA [Rhodanobacter thiooxydans]